MANLSAFGGAQPITPGGLVELGYSENDNAVTLTATSSASPDWLTPEMTLVCDGSPVLVEYYAPIARATQDAAGTGDQLNFSLVYDGSVQEDSWGRVANRNTAIGHLVPVTLQYRMTPAAGSHTFRVGGYVSNASRNGYVGAGSPYPPQFLRVSKIVQQNDGLKPFWTPPIVTQLPSNPENGDVVHYRHSAAGNIGAVLPMQYDGTKWLPLGQATLCRWSSGSNRMTLTTSSIVQQTGGDYNSLTFTPPWDGWYEISQRSGMIELNTGIGIYIHFGATDGSQYIQLNYCQDFNGYYYHTRFSTPNPMTAYLYASKSYRFYVQLSYPNTAYLNTFGNAYVKAVSA